jgi:redox-sensitive bicupin YhaK (pirin superfamily)
MIEGTMQHRDSIGGGGLIENGATQWMTAGSGILHIERPPESLVTSGGLFHGVQLWVNLPAAKKWVDPRYQDLAADDVVLLRSPDGGAVLRLIAGDLAGHAGPGSTYTPITYVHATVAPGAEVEVPWAPHQNALVYVLAGTGSVGPERAPLRTGNLAVLGDGDHLVLRGGPSDGPAESLEVLLLGGEPIREPVAQYGPFVMNTRAELQQAMDDFQAGKMGTVPG